MPNYYLDSESTKKPHHYPYRFYSIVTAFVIACGVYVWSFQSAYSDKKELHPTYDPKVQGAQSKSRYPEPFISPTGILK